jgi:MFS family permease
MAFLANLVGYGLVQAFGVFLKPLAMDLGWSRSVTVGAFSTYAIVHTILAFPVGGLIDRFGPKLAVLVSGLCLGLATFLMGYVSFIWQVYVFYGLLFSLGIAGIYTPLMATVSRWFKEKRGLAVGLTAAGIGAGYLVLSPLSAWLISSFGWRVAYVLLGVFTWIIFIPIARFVRKAPYSIADGGLSKLTIGVGLSNALRTRTFWAFGFTWLFAALVQWTIAIHIVPLVTDLGVPIVEAGVLAGLIGVGSLVARIFAGLISDIIGRRRVIVIALIIQLVAIVWLCYMKELWMLFIFVIIFGLGSGGWSGIIAAFPADYFGLKATGAILGFGVIMCGVGIAIGTYMGGYVFDSRQSYDYVLIVCAASTIAALIAALFLVPLKNQALDL